MMSERSRDVVSPDGLLRVEFDEFEPRMSHRVYNPRITVAKSREVLLDLWGTPWDGEVNFEGSGEVVLYLKRYPGTILGFTIHIDPRTGTFFFEDLPERREHLSDFRRRLERRHLERQQKYNELHETAAPATLSTRIGKVWHQIQLLMFLILSLLFVCGGVWWVLSGDGGIGGWIVIVGALGGLIFAINDIRDAFRSKR